MELNIPFSDAIELPEAFGISPIRQRELSRRLDAMVEGYGKSPVWIRTHDVFADMAAFCETIEELLYCTLLHMGWHQRRGMLLATGGPQPQG